MKLYKTCFNEIIYWANVRANSIVPFIITKQDKHYADIMLVRHNYYGPGLLSMSVIKSDCYNTRNKARRRLIRNWQKDIARCQKEIERFELEIEHIKLDNN